MLLFLTSIYACKYEIFCSTVTDDIWMLLFTIQFSYSRGMFSAKKDLCNAYSIFTDTLILTTGFEASAIYITRVPLQIGWLATYVKYNLIGRHTCSKIPSLTAIINKLIFVDLSHLSNRAYLSKYWQNLKCCLPYFEKIINLSILHSHMPSLFYLYWHSTLIDVN